MIRVGVGYDSHRFTRDRPLVLGGETIPHPQGLAGHSDGDAIAHALTDALLGAAGAGDIGECFPDTDARWQGADSIDLLRRAVAQLRTRGVTPLQADITVITEAPKIGPHRAAMRRRLADAIGVDPERIGLKGKTNEGMGWIGRGEGLAVIAVATVEVS